MMMMMDFFPWVRVYILYLMWIISLPSLHKNIKGSASVESKYNTVEQDLKLFANYSLSFFHLLSFKTNKKWIVDY